MRRRLLVLATAGITSLSFAARGQSARKPVIGVLVGRDEHFFADLFGDGMRERGWAESSYSLMLRSAGGAAERLAPLAEELVDAKVDAIVAIQTPAVLAAKRATQTIPIVIQAGAPVSMGIVDSVVRPGGNITGVDGAALAVGAKRVELMRELVPSAKRIAVLLNRPDPFNRPFLEQVQVSAATFGLQVDPIPVTAPDLDTALGLLQSSPPDIVIVQPSLPLKAIANRLRTLRLPSVSQGRFYVESGGLMAIGANTAEINRLLAFCLTQVLKGTPPRDIPVMQPTQFDLFLNLTTARALGLSPAPALVQRANEVIE